MSYNTNQSNIKVKFSYFRCLMELIGIIGICYICGCEWARGCVLRCVREIHGAWATSSSSQSSDNPPSCGEGLQPAATDADRN